MTLSLDVIANSNPAICALTLYVFGREFTNVAGTPPDVLLGFLPVPIALSTQLARTFEGTNRSTGLLTWRARNPEVILDLPLMLREAVPLSRRAFIFGMRHGILSLTHNGTFTVNPAKLQSEPKDWPAASLADRPFTIAKRLGAWCGKLNSTPLTFTTLGIQP